MSSDSAHDLFETAYAKLLAELPDSIARGLSKLRTPELRWVRLTTGVVFIAGGSLSFLPVLGLELLPLGLLFVAQDVPFLREPTGKLLLWLLARWHELKRRAQTFISGPIQPDASSFN